MRLIDADELINEMKKWYWDSEKQRAAELDNSPMDLFTNLAITTVKDQPTAYDIDKGRADAMEEMKSLVYEFDDYCDAMDCLNCWMNKSDEGCFRQWCRRKFEQLKEQNSIIDSLKPKCSNEMPKEIVCNCTKELTYGEIFEHFLENCEPKLSVEDYRPCVSMYGVPDIPYAIVIWLANGTKIIYIDK